MNKRILAILAIMLLPAVTPLMQPGYPSMHDDLQAMRQLQMDKCFRGRIALWQIPCRWVPDMGYGFGYPLFNYYPPLPYFLGQGIHWLGFSFTGTVKVVAGLGFAGSLAAMYLLAKEYWGQRGATVAGLMYLYAPYHSTDFYVRGAVNEFWALVWLPLVFWTTYRLIRDGSKWIVWTALTMAALLLTHNLTLLIVAVPYLLWIAFWLIKLRSIRLIRSISNLALAGFWSFGLAAFFTLPVVLESRFVSLWTLTAGYFNYLAHFLDWRQMLVKINWGYGESVLGPADTMSFAVGYLHWVIPVALMLALLFVAQLRRHWTLLTFGLCTLLFSLFMMHWKATPLWQAIKPLEFLQFPWRFLTLTIFIASLVSGAVVTLRLKLLIPLLLSLVLLLNADYFRPRQWYPDMTDAVKFSGDSWRLQRTGSIFDFLPMWAPLPPVDPQSEPLVFTAGEGIYKVNDIRSNFQQYSVVASSSATLEVQTLYFPGWRMWLDKLEVAIDPSRDPVLGRMRVDVAEGNHDLILRFLDTPVRFAANALSLLAWSALVLYLLPWPKLRTSS